MSCSLLFFLQLRSKIEKTTTELLKLNSLWKPSEGDDDVEILTNEERECLRRIGLRMNSSLVLGRRGVFDGVMEGLHQHWKHREVAKVITMQKVFSRVVYTATSLEAESNGVLISIEKLKEGHAILMYRGRNYKRPSSKFMAQNLLTKRKALQRSVSMQRLGVSKMDEKNIFYYINLIERNRLNESFLCFVVAVAVIEVLCLPERKSH